MVVYQHLYEKLKHIYPAEEIRAMSRIVISDALALDPLKLITSEISLTDSDMVVVDCIANELATGKPLQYVLGATDFYNCKIKVNPATLIPRPETEELVSIIIQENRLFHGKIIDIGTGSGCIAIALAKNMDSCQVYATDYSAEAISIATSNAVQNGVDITFLQDDIFNSEIDDCFDIIVSNPPYVCESEKATMAPNVINFEPHTALFVPNDNPLLYYKAIFNFAETRLTNSGALYFEVNEHWGTDTAHLASTLGYSNIELKQDLFGKDRFVVARKTTEDS